MKREWRSGRIVLAVLVLGFGALVLYLWPVQPLWRVPFDMAEDYLQVLGIDESKQIVYTHYSASKPDGQVQAEFRGYELYSGKLAWSLPTSQLDQGAESIQDDRDFELSSDTSQMISHKRGSDEIELRRFPSCELQHRIKITRLNPGEQICASLTADGKRLLVLTLARLLIIDCASAVVETELEIPAFSESYPMEKLTPMVDQANPMKQLNLAVDASAGWAEKSQPVQITRDVRFLATIDKDVRTILVYFLPAKKLIARLPGAGVPRFLEDEKTLVIVPQNNFSIEQKRNQPRYYQLEESGVREVQGKSSEPMIQGETVCCDQQRIAVLDYQRRFLEKLRQGEASQPAWAKWEWLSDEYKMKIASWLGYLTLNVPLNIHYLPSGKLERTCELSFGYQAFFSSYLYRNQLTRDGRVLVLSDGTSVSCWMTVPYRPVSFWATLSGSVVIASWLAWPRQIKVQKQLVKS